MAATFHVPEVKRRVEPDDVLRGDDRRLSRVRRSSKNAIGGQQIYYAGAGGHPGLISIRVQKPGVDSGFRRTGRRGDRLHSANSELVELQANIVLLLVSICHCPDPNLNFLDFEDPMIQFDLCRKARKLAQPSSRAVRSCSEVTLSSQGNRMFCSRA